MLHKIAQTNINNKKRITETIKNTQVKTGANKIKQHPQL